jgi:hypothetical protein
MESTISLKSILEWERLPLFGRYGYINDKVFNDKNSSILQVIYRAIGTLRLWSSLQRLEDCDLYMEVCARLEAKARDIFSQHGWPHSLRIGASS